MGIKAARFIAIPPTVAGARHAYRSRSSYARSKLPRRTWKAVFEHRIEAADEFADRALNGLNACGDEKFMPQAAGMRAIRGRTRALP
jgi:hypothetical protein